MGEFANLSRDLIPVFAQIEEIKDRYGITSLSLESFHTIDQFYGSHGGKMTFWDTDSGIAPGTLKCHSYIKSKSPEMRNLRASHIWQKILNQV